MCIVWYQSLFAEAYTKIIIIGDEDYNTVNMYLQMEIQVSIGIKQLWV